MWNPEGAATARSWGRGGALPEGGRLRAWAGGLGRPGACFALSHPLGRTVCFSPLFYFVLCLPRPGHGRSTITAQTRCVHHFNAQHLEVAVRTAWHKKDLQSYETLCPTNGNTGILNPTKARCVILATPLNESTLVSPPGRESGAICCLPVSHGCRRKDATWAVKVQNVPKPVLV